MRELQNHEIGLVSGGNDMEEVIVTAKAIDDSTSGGGGFSPSAFGGFTLGLGPALGFSAGGGDAFAHVGVGIGFKAEVGVAQDNATASSQAEQHDGLTACLAVCSTIGADFSPAFAKGVTGIGVFFTVEAKP